MEIFDYTFNRVGRSQKFRIPIISPASYALGEGESYRNPVLSEKVLDRVDMDFHIDSESLLHYRKLIPLDMALDIICANFKKYIEVENPTDGEDSILLRKLRVDRSDQRDTLFFRISGFAEERSVFETAIDMFRMAILSTLNHNPQTSQELEHLLERIFVTRPCGVDQIWGRIPRDFVDRDISADRFYQHAIGNWEPEVKYDDDAEEHAHELLKEMLSKKEFETYRDEGYLKVKGTYNRSYVIYKKAMIHVTQELKRQTKTYKLCIEPRDHGTVCPTDEVIMKYKLIKSNEKMLHDVGIKWEEKTVCKK